MILSNLNTIFAIIYIKVHKVINMNINFSIMIG